MIRRADADASCRLLEGQPERPQNPPDTSKLRSDTYATIDAATSANPLYEPFVFLPWWKLVLATHGMPNNRDYHLSTPPRRITYALTLASILWLFRTFTNICVLPLTASYNTPNGPDLRSAVSPEGAAASAMVACVVWRRSKLIAVGISAPYAFLFLFCGYDE